MKNKQLNNLNDSVPSYFGHRIIDKFKSTSDLPYAIENMPAILVEDTYFTEPAKSLGKRKMKEKKMHSEVQQYLNELGFEISKYGKMTIGRLIIKGRVIDVQFSYEESSTNVFKKFDIYENGVVSNIGIIKKILTLVEVRRRKIKMILAS